MGLWVLNCRHMEFGAVSGHDVVRCKAVPVRADGETRALLPG